MWRGAAAAHPPKSSYLGMVCSEVQDFHEKCCQFRLMGDQVLLLHASNVLLQNVHKGTQAVLPKQKQSDAKATVILTVIRNVTRELDLCTSCIY